MHVDARKIENHSFLAGDVCIVGAGAAGISMALDWIGSKYKVILLESGGFDYDDKVQDLYKGKSTGQKYYPLRASRLSYFGGTTGHWSGMCSPFDEVDFMKRDWVPHSGWPISKKDLDPFYARANEKLKLGPYRYDLEYWQKEKPNLKPFPLDQDVVWHKMWQISPTTGMFDGGGFNKYYKDDIVKAKNVHLYTYATVVNVVANENVSRISEVQIKNLDGKTHTVKAKHFILAGGAIQNARILLASNTQAKRGLGNDNDLVGRYFMEHLEIQTAELWLLKPFDTAIFTRGKLWCELAITEKAQRENKILSGTAGPKPLIESRLTLPRMEAWQNEDPRKSREHMLENRMKASVEAKKEKKVGAMANAYEFQTRMEQAPNPDSRITIGPEIDALGMPLANLHWQLTELDKISVRRINQIIGREVGKAAFGRVRLKEFFRDDNDKNWPEGTNAGWHHMGTTRMGTDPKQSVVNPHCQVHGIDNLYIAGAACYTTAGAPNPTLTLIALSLRLSDHVKECLETKL